MKPHPYEAAAAAELAKHPGVRVVGRERRGKSMALVLEFNGQQRRVFYPCTPSDHRGPPRHVQDIRLVLRVLGAIV